MLMRSRTAPHSAGFADQTRDLAVVTAATPWWEPPRIRHQVTRQLCRFYNVLYVELPFGSCGGGDQLEQISERLVVLRPRRIPRGFGGLWENLPAAHKLYNSYLATSIEARLRTMPHRDVVLVNFHFNFPEIMKLGVFSRKLYFCNDEFPKRATTARKRRMLRRYENEVIESADICLTVSYPLLRKLSALTPHAGLFLPGHEFEIEHAGGSAVQMLAKTKPIKVCFMGYLNRRVRFDWLLELAQGQDVVLTLVGPHERDVSLGALARLDSVRLVEPLEGKHLQDELRKQDVLIMPYDTNKVGVQAASAPNKLFQYLACGRPVVISDMPSFIELPEGFVYRAVDAKSFVQAVRQAFDEDSVALTRARLEYAAENSWDIRGDDLRRIIKHGLGERA